MGVVIRTNGKVFWARNSSNPQKTDVYEIRVYEHVWMQKKEIQYTSQIDFEDKLCKHIHKDNQLSDIIVNDVNRMSEISEEREEDVYDVNNPLELAGCYGYA